MRILMQPATNDFPDLKKDDSGNILEIGFTTAHVNQWVASNLLPPELATSFFEMRKREQDVYQKVKDFKENNPNIADNDLQDFITKERNLLIAETNRDAARYKSFHDYLIENWDLLISDLQDGNYPIGLFKNVDNHEEYGISRTITDSVQYLEKLLNDLTPNNIYDTLWEAKGEIKNSRGEAISLSYTFQAPTPADVIKILEDYKRIMLTRGLKIWMAYWKIANEAGSPQFTCPMIEIMKRISADNREAHFSVKEKQEHWAITKMLEKTKLVRERPIKKRGSSKERTQWIEQPLLEILGGEKESDAYPDILAVRVLLPRTDKRGFVPAIYKNATLTLHPNDTRLAFAIQTRAAQRNRGQDQLSLDWEYLFELGNLKETASSNSRVAKAVTRKKMNKLKQNAIIKDWDEELLGLSVTPQSQKKKTKKTER
jgi:hypothetical protein